ncbi:MAG: hypothetical protein EP347_12585 [Alphaproteobacteria bacterium]|nr:MAG: hypothetical protein EP347_12585 [Alphaproteobacteria bacterium]
MKLIRGIISLVTGAGVIYGTWRVYDGNDLELAALAFGALAIGRAVLMAWLRREDDVSALFKSKATSFIRTPLQEFAFLVPLYAAPGLYTQFGLMKTLLAVPVAWIVLRGLVRFVFEGPPKG